MGARMARPNVDDLEDLLRRLAASHEDLIRDTDDPGTEALSVQYLVRQKVGQGPVVLADPLDVEAIANDLDSWGLDSPDDFRAVAKVVVDGIRARMDLR